MNKSISVQIERSYINAILSFFFTKVFFFRFIFSCSIFYKLALNKALIHAFILNIISILNMGYVKQLKLH